MLPYSLSLSSCDPLRCNRESSKSKGDKMASEHVIATKGGQQQRRPVLHTVSDNPYFSAAFKSNFIGTRWGSKTVAAL
jgi:hypothetical protein